MRVTNSELRKRIRKILLESPNLFDVTTDVSRSAMTGKTAFVVHSPPLFEGMIDALMAGGETGSTGFGQFFETVVSKVAQIEEFEDGGKIYLSKNVEDLNTQETGNFEFADIATASGDIAILYSVKMSRTPLQPTGVTVAGTLQKGVNTAVNSSGNLSQVSCYTPGYIGGYPLPGLSKKHNYMGLGLGVKIIIPEITDSGIRILPQVDNNGVPYVVILDSSTNSYYPLKESQRYVYFRFQNTNTAESTKQVMNKIFTTDLGIRLKKDSESARAVNEDLIKNYFNTFKSILQFNENIKAGESKKRRPAKTITKIKIPGREDMSYSEFVEFVSSADYKFDAQLYTAYRGPRGESWKRGVEATGAPEARKPFTRIQMETGNFGFDKANIVRISAYPDTLTIGGQTYTREAAPNDPSTIAKYSVKTQENYVTSKEFRLILTPLPLEEFYSLANAKGDTLNTEAFKNANTTTASRVRKYFDVGASGGMMISKVSPDSIAAGDAGEFASDEQIRGKTRVSTKGFKPAGKDITRAFDPKTQKTQGMEDEEIQAARDKVLGDTTTTLGKVRAATRDAEQQVMDNLDNDRGVPTSPTEKADIMSGMKAIAVRASQLIYAWSTRRLNPKPFIKAFLRDVKRYFPEIFQEVADEDKDQRLEESFFSSIAGAMTGMSDGLAEVTGAMKQVYNYVSNLLSVGDIELASQTVMKFDAFLTDQINSIKMQEQREISEDILYENILKKILYTAKKRQ